MPPKAATTKAPAKRAAAPEHPPYKEMIKEAILALKDRNGSSRPALKKYIKANYKGVDNDRFDSLFNQSLKKGADSNEFSFPKGPSGTVKLVKKEAAPKAKPAASATTKKTTTAKTATKSTTAKKPAAKKTATAKPKAAATKKTTTTAAKPKANAKKPRKESAPAVVEKPAVLTKTKSGRVSKGTAPKAAAPKKKAAAPKKKATPKKAAAAAES